MIFAAYDSRKRRSRCEEFSNSIQQLAGQAGAAAQAIRKEPRSRAGLLKRWQRIRRASPGYSTTLKAERHGREPCRYVGRWAGTERRHRSRLNRAGLDRPDREDSPERRRLLLGGRPPALAIVLPHGDPAFCPQWADGRAFSTFSSLAHQVLGNKLLSRKSHRTISPCSSL